MVSTTGQIPHNKSKKRHVATKQVPPEVLFVRKKARRNFLQ